MYLVAVCFSFFFFKQKTAYEMRISDWSSDVCSSDLTARQCHRDHRIATAARTRRCAAAVPLAPRAHATLARLATCRRRATAIAQRLAGAMGYPRTADRKSTRLNSRSLMRISYAVFCLKKKKKNKTYKHCKQQR